VELAARSPRRSTAGFSPDDRRAVSRQVRRPSRAPTRRDRFRLRVPIMRIQGGTVLVNGQLVETDVDFAEDEGLITAIGTETRNGRCIDASGCIVLPGIVDIHADAFERQLMPRPGVAFPIDIALADSDRQVISNGITTIYHGVTWSWEPGLRGADN